MEQAIHLMERKLGTKVRKSTGVPYMAHLYNCLSFVADYGGDEIAQTAAILHDAVEDAGVTYTELENQFGREVADIVATVTEDKRIAEWSTRKLLYANALRLARPRVILVALADKVDNIRGMVRGYHREGLNFFSRFNAGMGAQVAAHTAIIEAVEANPSVQGEALLRKAAAELRQAVEQLAELAHYDEIGRLSS